MRYSREFLLKDGRPCLVRHARGEDAASVLRLMIASAGETDNMARYPDEITLTEEQERGWLEQTEADPRALLLAAYVDGELVGNAGFSPVLRYFRGSHRAELGIGIARAWWGQGIGTALMTAALEAAQGAGYEQMEMEVLTSNARGLALYRRFGFSAGGVLERGFRYRDGRYADLFHMTRRL